jgi:hypothetical protein
VPISEIRVAQKKPMKIIDVPQSGKCGLTVSFQGRNGLVRRSWVVPANPRTPAQLTQRSCLAASAQAFNALTESQQNAWNAAASSQMTRSRLGQNGPLTGLQLFTKINATLRTFGQPTVDVPPALPTFPDLAPQNLVITNTGGVVAIKLTCPTDPGANTIIRASKPQNSGVRRTPGVVILGVCPAPVAGAADITGLYTAKYGVPGVGSRLFVQCNQFVDGYESIPVSFSALVPA